ncbi:hypothetical protein Glove_134g220 [Diversispora epigaea]|uniref:Stress-associated endoplasmic reticulum protein n=1 Tax=Diversispora epigaea TaxID=1348612 RepID=A0A397IX52_9GLOM|nr:hypothetical protein Glove_134g220 [Diversispora epigaea]
MPGTTNPIIRKKNLAYATNIHNRGHVKTSLRKEKESQLPVGYFTLGIILFVVVGSSIFEMLKFI